jgi:hypothetical protein
VTILSDGLIRQAIKRVHFTGREEILRDGEGLGVGRLTLIIRPMPKRVTTYWMAVQFREGKPAKVKLGDYPAMSLAQAREVFERDYAELIQKGRGLAQPGCGHSYRAEGRGHALATR